MAGLNFGEQVTTATKRPVHFFIDTNIFLNFFAYSKDDLAQLQKLIELLRTRRAKLYLTQQVVDEFYRNRETKLAESLAGFNQWKLATCPSFMLPLAEYEEFKKCAARFEKAHQDLLAKAKADAECKSLMADGIFLDLRRIADVIPTDSDSYEAAFRRLNLGNPPGKVKGVGDKLNWELLLKHVTEGNDLHILTRDGDYASKLTPTVAKTFLEEEWREKKSASVHIYEQIGQFFSENFPDNDFALDIEKRDAIEFLASSGAFSTTHRGIVLLRPYIGFFTGREVEELIQCAQDNTQVGWIMGDPDVLGFYSALLEKHADDIPETVITKLKTLVGTV